MEVVADSKSWLCGGWTDSAGQRKKCSLSSKIFTSEVCASRP